MTNLFNMRPVVVYFISFIPLF